MRKTLVYFVFLLSCIQVFGQSPSSNDPITAVGIGRINPTNLQTTFFAGGLNATNNGAFIHNTSNPASLGSLTKYTLFDVSVNGSFNQLSINNSKNNYAGGSLDNLSLAMPLFNQKNEYIRPDSLRPKLGLGLNLKNFSDIGYQINTSTQVGGADDILETVVSGTGNTSVLGLDLGVRYRNHAFGLGLDYQFSSIQDETLVLPLNSGVDSRIIESNSDFNLRVFKVKPGVITDLDLKNIFLINRIKKDSTLNEAEKIRKIKNAQPLKLTGGAYAKIPFSARSLQNGSIFSRNSFTAADTIRIADELEEKLDYPVTFGAGVSIARGGKWVFGIDGQYDVWSQFKGEFRDGNFTDSYKVSVGGQYTPLALDITNYLNRIQYRGTAYAGQYYLIVNNEQTYNYGIGFGLGLPIKLAKYTDPAFINLGFDLGRFDTSDDYYNSDYLRINLGFTLTSDDWFIKRKIK